MQKDNSKNKKAYKLLSKLGSGVKKYGPALLTLTVSLITLGKVRKKF